jgi:hypothetical protein
VAGIDLRSLETAWVSLYLRLWKLGCGRPRGCAAVVLDAWVRKRRLSLPGITRTI